MRRRVGAGDRDVQRDGVGVRGQADRAEVERSDLAGPEGTRCAALTGAVAMLTGPTIRSLVERGLQSARRVRVLEPAGLRFDAVLSVFGVMFAPDHRRAAGEIMRAVRPGGTIGLAAWTLDGFVGELFGVITRHVPGPPIRPERLTLP